MKYAESANLISHRGRLRMASVKKPSCKFGAKCYRKNKQHRKEYSHPDDEEDREETKVALPPKKHSPEEPPKKKPRTLDDFFMGGRKKESELAKTESPAKKIQPAAIEEKISPAKNEERQKKIVGNTSGYKREKVAEEAASDDEPEDGPASPTDVKENIKSKFLVEMPDDFYEFWEFAKSLKPSNPRDAFKSSLGLQLVGPFDLLAGRSCHKNQHGKRPCYLRHWRYYYDPPEFLTVVRGDDKTQFHMGYFRDDPKEMPTFVGSNEAKDNCTISPRGENIFAAILWFIDDLLKNNKTDKLKQLKASLSEWAKKGGYPLELRTKRMKARDKNVVCKSFHGAGIVVPVDPVTEVGYRPVPETPGHLKKIFKKITNSETDEERNTNFDPLMDIITLVQFANDECDYGEGLELGIDLFCYGGHIFHKTILNLLPLGYEFLGRNEFGKILQAHLEQRKHSADLDELA